MKQNCWSFSAAEGTPGVSILAILAYAPQHKSVGSAAFTGENAGRACWVISGDLGKREIQGTFAKKYRNCEICDFYAHLKKEEYPLFQLSAVLLSRLR